MPDEYILKEYEGGSVATTLTALISAGATSITVASGSSFPTGSTAPFVVVIDRGLATEEKVLIASRAANTLTVQQRGYDGTVAQSHATAAAINHCVDAYTLEQVNAMANAMTTQYDLVYRGASAAAFGRIAAGTNGQILQVAGGVPGFAALGLGMIPDGLITQAKLAAALQNLLVPAGTVCSTVAATPDTGWLFHNQAVLNASTLYPSLWAKAPASWKSGATLTIPNFTDMAVMQAGTTALGATGGANSRTIATGNLPSHAHDLGSHAHTATAGLQSADHAHSGTTTSNGDHEHGADGGLEYILQAAGGGSVFASGSGVSVAASTTTANAGTHNHTMTTGGVSANHSHTITVNAASGNTGSIGSGTALTTTPAHVALNWMIKAH